MSVQQSAPPHTPTPSVASGASGASGGSTGPPPRKKEKRQKRDAPQHVAATVLPEVVIHREEEEEGEPGRQLGSSDIHLSTYDFQTITFILKKTLSFC